jgi:TPR repeat protein
MVREMSESPRLPASPLEPPPLPRGVDNDRKEHRLIVRVVASAIVFAMFFVATVSAAIWLKTRPSEEIRQSLAKESKGEKAVADEAFRLCSDGRQRDAEKFLDTVLKRHENKWPRAWFFRGVLKRSRFGTAGAAFCFDRVIKLAPGSPEARAGEAVEALDDDEDIPENLQKLRDLIEKNPKEPLFVWLLAIQCRAQKHGDEGEATYRKLATSFGTGKGPAMFHQTFANILMEYQHKHEEALEHYQKVVKMEPRAWNYDGMARALEQRGRNTESDHAHEKATKLDPGSSDYWRSWGNFLVRTGRTKEAFSKFEKAYELNPANDDALCSLGWALENAGRYKDALEKYKQAAEMGNETAMANLANFNLYGKGCDTNYRVARTWAERAIKAGGKEAYQHLGKIYSDGLGVPRDYEKAVKLLEEGAGCGDTGCMTQLAWLVQHGNGAKRDPARAYELYVKASKLGDDWGTFKVAQSLQDGFGVKRDRERAFGIFQELHARGFNKPYVAGFLGVSYFNGWGVATNMELAARYYTEAVDGGETWWLSSLAAMHQHGCGVPLNLTRALELYKKHADTGEPAGCNSYAWILATATNPAVWDGPRAVEYALKAVGMNSNDASRLDTLAAAYARAGRFDEAVAAQTKAAELIEKNKRKDEQAWLTDFRARIERYRRHETYEDSED